MIPTVSQQLQAIKRRIEETIIPELPENAKFAREQAAFIVISLDWLLDINEHQYRYEVVENMEYRQLLADMIDRSKGEIADDSIQLIRRSLLEPKPPQQDAIIPLQTVIEQNRKLKKLAAELFTMFSKQNGSHANPARDLFARVALRQGRRELAFFSRTGYVEVGNTLGMELGHQGVNSELPNQ